MPRTVLITGCSDGGLGAALAVAFHKNGDRVFATARNPAKMAGLKTIGIQTLPLDVLSDESIKSCAQQVSELTNGSLDILINNAGAGYCMPLTDASIPECQKLFDLNVWSILRMVQHFLSLLQNSQSGAIIANNTSVASVVGTQWSGPYSASKAAASMITETLRLELQPFKIRVIDLKTGGVRSNFWESANSGSRVHLPDTSIYLVAKDKIESVMNDGLTITQMDANLWAGRIVGDLSRPVPPHQVWRGDGASGVRWASFFPVGSLDWRTKQMTGGDILDKKLEEAKKTS